MESKTLSKPVLLCFEDEQESGARIAQAGHLDLARIERHRFPDGETRLLAAHTARALGARHLTLVAPYLAYMRQDVAFHPGEAMQVILDAGVGEVWSTDCINHSSNSVSMAAPIAEALTLMKAAA